MAKVKLSADAKSDLRDIYYYGYRVWGKYRADNFQQMIKQHFIEIAKHPLRFPMTTKFVKNCRKSVFRKLSIYFDACDDHVEILAVIRHQDLSERFPYKR